MSNYHKNIAIVDSSDILFEGLSIILLKTGAHYHLFRFSDLEELNIAFLKNQFDVVFVGLTQAINRVKMVKSLKKINDSVSWIGIDCGICNQELCSLFHEIVYLNDSSNIIIQKLNKTSRVQEDALFLQHEELSDRELEVLSLLAQGLPNKEIADRLMISVHTVVTHRKNIIQKTGIKSQAGLTIYAITKKIISVNGFIS